MGIAAIAAIIVLVLLAVVVLKVLGALIGFAIKLVLLFVAVGIALFVYSAVKKQIGGPRD